MPTLSRFIKSNRGDAVVEATILFPIMIMIFAAIVLLSIYLPQRAVLHNAAQLTATAIAKEFSDTGFHFDDATLQESFDFDLHPTIFNSNRDHRNGFWYRAFGRFNDAGTRYEERAQNIVDEALSRGFQITNEPVDVGFDLSRTLLYTEIHITVSQAVPFPVNLSFIGFPEEIVLEQTASAFVADGSGFLRGVDDAFAVADIGDRIVDNLTFILQRFGVL